MKIRHHQFISMLFVVLFTAGCSDLVVEFEDFKYLFATPVPGPTPEPMLEDILLSRGYGQDVIDQPLNVETFLSTGETTFRIIETHSNASFNIGWYQSGNEHFLMRSEVVNQIPTTISAKQGEPFGLILKVYPPFRAIWYSEASKNQESQQVKIYPKMEDGKVIEDAFLLFWEDQSSFSGTRGDFQDTVMEITGVKVVEIKYDQLNDPSSDE